MINEHNHGSFVFIRNIPFCQPQLPLPTILGFVIAKENELKENGSHRLEGQSKQDLNNLTCLKSASKSNKS